MVPHWDGVRERERERDRKRNGKNRRQMERKSNNEPFNNN
jgi:hypothetical protein